MGMQILRLAVVACVALTLKPHCGQTASAPGAATLEVTFLKLTADLRSVPVVLRTPGGFTYVYDTGLGDQTGLDIATFLKSKGIARIDGLLISHPHGDHYAGARWLINNFPVSKLYDSGYTGGSFSTYKSSVLAAAANRGVQRVTPLHAGQKLAWDDALDVEVLNPPDPYFSSTEIGATADWQTPNENSVVLRIQHGDAVFLLTGDMDRYADRYLRGLVRNGEADPKRIDAHVVWTPHHGQFYTQGFRDAVSPLLAVMGKGDEAWRKEASWSAGQDLYRTWIDGHVAITSTGDRLTVRTGAVTKEYTVGVSKYAFAPFFSAGGSSFMDLADGPDLRLSRFSVAAWFRSIGGHVESGMIADKGGVGFDSGSENLNYGIWMRPDGRLEAGFEDAGTGNYFAVSPGAYADGSWHHSVVTYDGARVRLHLDGMPVAEKPASAVPASNGKPLRVGANARDLSRWFRGDIDEVRVWSRALPAAEIADQYLRREFSTSGLAAYLDMGVRRFGAALDIPFSESQKLTRFSIQVVFRTTQAPVANAVIVNRGGLGREEPGLNLNYGVWVLPDGRLRGGFESADGANYFVDSAAPVNDGPWHSAALTYDGASLRLTVDGVASAPLQTSAGPDTGSTAPLRLGANVLNGLNPFEGDLDVVKVANVSTGATVYWNSFHQGGQS